MGRQESAQLCLFALCSRSHLACSVELDCLSTSGADLKHLASQEPGPQATAAIEAIAAAFASPSALLKHELAYCLGQSGKEEAIPYLRDVIEDRQEDAMCRHEAAEALGALGDSGSLELLKQRRDDPNEEEVVRETCDIAVERIEWEHSESRQRERLKQR